ncbi:hypothetical protein [Thiorhodovibrio frisius]|uniref:Uncharacterized protein n=1 Tax=Thiorhodovibrio frisius TaxID=631362 RepID=H8Z708_9GAMM|nr:hypothetical protein [Thiorhodovibrio frisius]EIC19793.1 hypothetical protein Thi970DRAFT_03393 [Thiorhodovibrio frisius]WPL20232.1 hypothetical protein Thiofri_00308 [Thiorhodovibrio frisius]
MANETKYEFTLILAGVTELSSQIADALFVSGCDDGSPGSCGGQVTVDFCRQATSLETAIRTAVRDVSKAGFRVERVELESPQLLSA